LAPYYYYVKNRNAEEYREQFPRAAVLSFTSEEEGIDICKQIVQVHNYGGFELCNFWSNSDTLQSVMNGKNFQKLSSYLQNQLSSEKFLGMY